MQLPTWTLPPTSNQGGPTSSCPTGRRERWHKWTIQGEGADGLRPQDLLPSWYEHSQPSMTSFHRWDPCGGLVSWTWPPRGGLVQYICSIFWFIENFRNIAWHHMLYTVHLHKISWYLMHLLGMPGSGNSYCTKLCYIALGDWRGAHTQHYSIQSDTGCIHCWSSWEV